MAIPKNEEEQKIYEEMLEKYKDYNKALDWYTKIIDQRYEKA